MKLSIRQQALLIVLLYAAIFFIAFAISKTLLYVFVFSLISILVVNFIYKNLLKIKIPHPISVTLSLIIYFGVLVYAFVNIIPLVVNQIGSFYEFMKKILDSKYWENYLVDNPELSKVIGNLADWASPRISELFNNFLLDFAKKLPGIGVIIFYSILFTVYVTIYTKWTTKSLPGLFPKRVRPLIEDFLTKLGNSLQSYVDVILLGALIVGVSFYFLFTIFLPEYTILLSFWGFITNFIPIVGVVIEWIPILIVTLGLGFKNFLIVNSIVAIVHLGAFLFFIFIMKHKADINPVLMLIFIFLVGLVYGLVGTFFAVPVAIFFVTLWNEFIKSELDETRI
ncbi:MAG: AI-2E family transporter [Fervidobacterium pennivorans]|uniref:AI-2E family transporter n=4 Tax=Fervidobacterium pennivorans TaxID=93466 RepID=A0A172T3Y6_FERPE|nr:MULTISPECIES: AI-2E family transporter [Fervidobacterium]AFG35953.1 putative permease [Fervidobacterium pennivorans DSM 9078]ANE41687.1 permease [Fervidobacterium pennivorans]NPU89481.1 AI-2E family transporter [Fervidobacterium sp.]QIV79012.1 AI-2E family transporter [Fervidobacterium pennivorans subsp. keratinolyticus]